MEGAMETPAVTQLFRALVVAFALVRPAAATVIAGPLANPANGHFYHLLAPATWTDSEAEAVGLGGHLATIRNQDENAWVFNTFSPLAHADAAHLLWIGLSDIGSSGSFAWTSGEALVFKNWSTDNPDNVGTEHYVHMVGPDGPPAPGSWNNNV